MKINELAMPVGANRKTKRRGRGSGSGHGKTSCRGHKGAKSRSGRTTRPGFEGGQMPLMRRIPKRGFKSPFRIVYQIINISSLNRFDNDAIVGPAEFKKAGLVKSPNVPVKILGEGKFTKKLIVRAHKFSTSAVKAIETSGAKAELINS